jgi:hypothetical protein
MMRALFRSFRAAWLRYWSPVPDEVVVLDGELWERIGRVWHGPRGETVVTISGGQDFDPSGLTFETPPSGFGDFGSAPSAFDNFAQQFQAPQLELPQVSSAFGQGNAPQAPPPQSAFSKFAGDLGSNLSKEFSGSPISSLTKILGLGATGFGVANQLGVAGQLNTAQKQQQQALKAATSAAAPAVAFGTDTLNAAATGNLPAPLQAQIDEWSRQQKAAAASRLATMGDANSDAIESINRLIDEQAWSMKGSMLQQQEETGLAGINTGVNAATGAAGITQAQQAQLAQLIQGANSALGRLTGAAA